MNTKNSRTVEHTKEKILHAVMMYGNNREYYVISHGTEEKRRFRGLYLNEMERVKELLDDLIFLVANRDII